MHYFSIFQVFNHPLMHGPGPLGYLRSRPAHSQHIANTAYPNPSPVSGSGELRLARLPTPPPFSIRFN